MKIVKLSAENIKKLVAVEIEPDGNLVQITGKNGAGKTSLLDSIFWSLAGTKSHQSKPIRTGETEARIELDLGEVIVKRTFSQKEDKPVTTKVLVETSEGARFPSPQKMLDSLLDGLAFDPLAFARMDAKQQADALKDLVGLDFDAINDRIKEAYDERRAVNRVAKDARTAADAVDVPEGNDETADRVADLRRKLQEAVKHNNKRMDLLRKRQDAEGQLREAKNNADMAGAEVDRLQAMLDDAKARLTIMVDAVSAAQAALKACAAVPKTKDTRQLDTAIEQAQARLNDNQKRQYRIDEKKSHIDRAKKAEAKSKELTKAIDDAWAEGKAQLEAADMPVEGMSLDGGVVTYKGDPFDQLSSALQTRLSCAMAMRMNKKLRIVLIRDGSLLDSESLAVIANMAEEHDHQVWVEQVDETGKVGFVIEDGVLANA